MAINAAYQTVSAPYHLYSALGNYLGPASTDRKYLCLVSKLRDTKTFATRLVEVVQVQDDGYQRHCLFLTADFQRAEPSTFLTYSRPPRTNSFTSFEDSSTMADIRQSMLMTKVTDPKMVEIHKVAFGLLDRLVDGRSCREGVLTQNLTGFAKKGTPTTQDHNSLPQKTSGDWFKAKHEMKTPAEHVAGLAMIMDGALSFLALTHSGLSFADAGAQSSLDFAFRVFENTVNLNNWHLREMSTVTGGNGRTFNEAKTWDQEGRMVAEMTQQCILRPPKVSKI